MHRVLNQCSYTEKFHYLIISDVHFDSQHCNRDLLFALLNKAKECGAMVLIHGDWFDIMGCYGDPRSKADEIRSDYLSKDFSYLDMVIEDSIEALRPYADNILLMSEGNHETNIKRRHDTNPLKHVTDALKEHNPNLIRSLYSGWLTLSYSYYKGGPRNTSGSTESNCIHFHHGFGGSAKRSKGMLDVQTEITKYPEAQLLVRGHTHQKWYDPSTTRQRLNQRGYLFMEGVDYLQTGSFKDGHNYGEGGFEVEKNYNPTRLGGWWLTHLYHKKKGIKRRIVEADWDSTYF